MPQFCLRCQRANPDSAVFCYFDGLPLQAGAVPMLPSVAPGAELVYSSGRHCKNLAELAEACLAEWDESRQMLLQGQLVGFLKRLGRADLVQTAQEMTNHTDPDIALHNFLDHLPSGSVPGPRLELQPRRMVLKNVTVGKRPKVQLTVTNGGRGALQGKLMVSSGQEWIKIDGANGHLGLRAQRTQEVTLHFDTRVLLGGQSYTGKLTAITNGGIAEVPIRLEVAAVPFSQSPYQGALSPRELAQRMQKNPKPAVPLLESGEVSRWFAVNGWNYPVSGEPARGIGAVQQFFECLGLSKPPPLLLSDSEVRLQCLGDGAASAQVTLRTPSRKWVYAQVDSDSAWLRVTTPTVSGPQQVEIAFEVDPAGLTDGSHKGTVRIRANGNQKLTVRVQGDVQRPRESPADGLLHAVFVGAVLGLLGRWLLAIPADLFARLLLAHGANVGTLGWWAAVPGTGDGFLRTFVLATWWIGGLLGLGLVWRQGGKWADRLCGLVAGSAAGVALFSVLACLLILLDGLPRAVMQGLLGALGGQRSAWFSTPLWLVTAGLCWAMLGGCVGLVLGSLGERGRRWLSWLTAPLASTCRVLGLEGAARWLRG